MIKMSRSPVLSIIVTAHNCEAYLERCLQSTIESAGETFDASEIILIDDSSEDGTSEICRNFSLIHTNVAFYRVNFKNIGKVRNFALEKCTGQYITMIDGDDEVIPNALSEIFSILTEQKPDVLLTRLNEIYTSSIKTCDWPSIKAYPVPLHKAITMFLVHREVQAHFIGQFFRREILNGMQFPEFHCYEDAYLFPSVLVKCSSILFSRNGPYLYFKRANSLSVNIDPEKVSVLIKATEQMTVAFGEGYQNLIACHWINIQHRYKADIIDERDRARVMEFLRGISAFSFLCDPKVRMSFKKKYLELRFSNGF